MQRLQAGMNLTTARNKRTKGDYLVRIQGGTGGWWGGAMGQGQFCLWSFSTKGAHSFRPWTPQDSLWLWEF
jgi:hypothetical protein